MLSKKIGFTFFLTCCLTLPTFSERQILSTKFTDKAALAQNSPTSKNPQVAQILTLYQPLQHLQFIGEKVSDRGISYFSLDNLSGESTSSDDSETYSNLSLADLDVYQLTKGKDPDKVATILATLGLSHHLQGEYDQAIDYYKKSLEITEENHSDSELELILLGNLGLAHLQIGDYYADTVDYLDKYWRMVSYTSGNSKIGKLRTAQALGNLGNAYYGADLYVQAIAMQEKRLVLSMQIADKAEEARTFSDLGIVYQGLGDSKKAIDYQQKALTIAEQISNKSIASFALGNLGIIYQSQGNYTKAADYEQQRLDIANQLQDLRSVAEALANLGGVAYFQGDYNKATTLYGEAWKISWEKLHDADILYRIRCNQGLVSFQMGDIEQALKYYGEYYQYAYSRNSRREEGIAKINAAAARLKSGNASGAAKTLREAMEFWESLRARLGNNDGFKITIFETQNAPYNNLQTVLVDQNQPEAALEISERGRARAYAELLARRLSAITTRKQSPVEQLSSPTITEIKKIAQNHRATLVEYSIISANFQIQGKLETHESELLIWVIQPTGKVILRRVDLKPLWQCQNSSTCVPKELSDLTAKSRNFLSTRSRNLPQDGSSTSPGINQNPLSQLYELLIQPIADLLPPNPEDHLVFIPQRSLFVVPFAALQDSTGKYLIEQHTITIAPSIQVLDLTYQLRQQHLSPEKNHDSVLVVGNPTMPKVTTKLGEPPVQLAALPGAETEANAIAKILHTQALIGDKANKSTVLQRMGQAQLIHLATHGLLNDFQGLGIPGAIALAPDRNFKSQIPGLDNGVLTASEILNLKLPADLVVLSACNTGRGKITGDGVVGLSRSLVAAKVPSVIVSLWSVPDLPTSSLMTDFYGQIQHQPDKAKALRQSMLNTMKQYPYPLDWAAFTLIGEP